ncbi:MAG TPA: trypsin-like serine protease [Geminicoccaceae bacterium]|nr:trypsin-like serine protease [Geminicoccaceae bacterium]
MTVLGRAPDPSTVEPLPLPEVDDGLTLETLRRPEARSRRNGPSSPAQPPAPDANPPTSGLDAWLDNPAQAPFAGGPDLEPLAAAVTDGAPFTTSRVFPKEQLLSYPYTAIGRITFEDSTGNSRACSGAVIQLRLVLTAGHCVYDTENQEWYRNWVFYPQYYDGLSPLGAWATLQALTTSQWIRGGLPNPGDFAILVMVDQARPIGQVTGWLGWQAFTFREHFHQFGYPGNLDRGQRPQETSTAVASVLGNHFRWGTNQTFGSSGGPLIVNFGENGSGQNFASNRVIGVVSFGNPSAGFAASSKMRSNFIRLFRAACNIQPGNCASARTEAVIASR